MISPSADSEALLVGRDETVSCMSELHSPAKNVGELSRCKEMGASLFNERLW